jgi:hypothetical protein
MRVAVPLLLTLLLVLPQPASAAGFRSGDVYADSVKTGPASRFLWPHFTKRAYKY